MLSIESLMAAAVALMQTFTPIWYPEDGKFANPETESEREARMAMIGEVNAEAAYGTKGKNVTPWGPKDDLALLKAIQRGESGFEYRVHAGEESHIGTADSGKARCMGQIHWVRAWWTKEQWQALAGTDRAATRRCADAILRILNYHAGRCKLRRDIPSKKRWQRRLTMYEAKLLVRWYGNGHCGFRQTKTMGQKAVAFIRLQHKIDRKVSEFAAQAANEKQQHGQDRLVTYTTEE